MDNEETINGVAIPTFEAAHRACADENCTAIQHLIYAYEPAGEEAGAFRWAVAEALREHEGEMLTLMARAEKAEAERDELLAAAQNGSVTIETGHVAHTIQCPRCGSYFYRILCPKKNHTDTFIVHELGCTPMHFRGLSNAKAKAHKCSQGGKRLVTVHATRVQKDGQLVSAGVVEQYGQA
jgi:hypothetical protein